MRAFIPLLLLSSLLLTACSTPHYDGYKHKPYVIRGIRYEPIHPQRAGGFVEEGIASHYKEGNWLFPGKTAIGEKYRAGAMAGAHKTLPIPCRVKVTNLRNGKSVVIRVNDRGPFIEGRVVDVTPRVAKKLGFYHQGLAPVRVELIDVGDGRHRINPPPFIPEPEPEPLTPVRTTNAAPEAAAPLESFW